MKSTAPSKSEAKTRRKFIDPKLEAAGWQTHDWQIDWEYPITDGRIHFYGKVGRRGTPKRADYLLRYAPSVGIAVVEAKAESENHIVYKLWKSGISKRVLFIVDRNLLADQAFQDFNNAFDKDSCYRMRPDDETFPQGRAVYFGIYQTLVGIDDDGNPTDRPSRFREFEKDFFDLIVIDEAHRGGSKEDGTWSELLKYFSRAVQVGLTATPKRDENNNAYDYFGDSIVNYSLKDY